MSYRVKDRLINHPRISVNGFLGLKANELRGRGGFLNSRSMDDLFLKRVNSWQGIVKKEQESIFEKSIGSLRNLQFFFKDAISECACSF